MTALSKYLQDQDSAEDLLFALSKTLGQLHVILDQADTAELFYKMIIDGFSTIGAQTRHVLEFIGIFVSHVSVGAINYDLRERNLELEMNAKTAQSEINRLCEALLKLQSLKSEQILSFEGMSDCDTQSSIVDSSVGRERFYLIDHTVHHLALLKLMCHAAHIKLPEDIGVSAATMKYQSSQS